MLAICLIAGLLLAAGCQSPVAGTWKVGPDQKPTGKMEFGVMTLANDGTFTAEAKYENRSVVMSGCYRYDQDQLMFCMDDPEAKMRTYEAKLVGDKLTMSHEGTSVTLQRLKPCAKCANCKSGKCKCKT